MEKWMLIILLVPFSLGATINADSCSQAAVQDAIDSAVDGDIVIVPAGTCSWTTGTSNIPSVEIGKAITLQGAGIDQTIINDQTGSLSSQNMINMGSGSRVTGFTFSGMPRRNAAEPAISAGGTGWRIDHNKFTTTLDGRGVSVSGWGLVDNNQFIQTKQGVSVFGDGVASWERPLNLGTGEAVYVEDNLFDYVTAQDGALDAYSGARYVFRYNTLHNTNFGHHGLDSGGYRSPRSFEVYENDFNADSGQSIFVAWRARGGTGVLFNNRISGDYDGKFMLVYYRACCDYGANCGSWGTCDGTNPIDGNLDSTGWPCLDQPGRDYDADGDGVQEAFPVYEWGNTYEGADFDMSVNNPWPDCPYMDGIIQEGRDFLNDQQPSGYTPYTYPHPLRSEGCEPNCIGKECGTDGCGGSCGTCSSGQTCQSGTCVVPQSGAYYVDNSGSCSDSASYGSESNPFCTIGYAVSQISGGDKIYVKSGTYNENLYVTGPDGTAGSPTRILAYPGDTPILYGNGMNTGRVKFENAEYFVFDGFEITNYNQGLFLDTCTNIELLNLHIHHVGQQALTIHLDSSFITIDSCHIHDTEQWNYNGEGVYIGTGSSGPVDNTHDITVRNCYIHDTTDEAIEFKGGTYNCIAENNVIHDSATGSTWGAIEVNQHIVGVQQAIQEPRHIVRNNVLYNCDTAIRAGTSSEVYNNVIYNSDRGIYIDNLAGDSWLRNIYHNTIDLSSSNSLVNAGGSADIKNNIGPATSGNMATGNYFTSDYHLLAGSAPVNAGTNVGIAIDLDGNARDAQPDMGAYEYGSCEEITLSQLISIINDWKLGTKNINNVMQSIQQWKSGCP